MPYCENCGTRLSETAKFCSNCGSGVILPLSRTNLLDDEKIKSTLASNFFEISQFEKVYLGDKIPLKKLNAFASNFSPEIISFITAYVYHDSTLWGKGDDGYVIAQGNDNNWYLLLHPFGLEAMFISIFNNEIIPYIIDVDFSDRLTGQKSLILDIRNPEDNENGELPLLPDTPPNRALYFFLIWTLGQ